MFRAMDVFKPLRSDLCTEGPCCLRAEPTPTRHPGHHTFGSSLRALAGSSGPFGLFTLTMRSIVHIS
jgi:hypothetical protein